MWREIFGRDGLVNAVLGADIAWLGNPNTAIWTLIILAMWQFGSPMLIFLAGLKQIPREFYEAASIDGANGWQQFWRITLPLLTPILFFNLVMQLISGFMVFTQAFITVSLALRAFADPSGTTDWGAIFAMSSLSLAPVFVVFILFQRFLVEGISTTGLKG